MRPLVPDLSLCHGLILRIEANVAVKSVEFIHRSIHTSKSRSQGFQRDMPLPDNPSLRPEQRNLFAHAAA